MGKTKKKIGKDRVNIDDLNQGLSAPDFLRKKNWTIQNIRFRLEMIDLELSTKYKRMVMQKIEHRIKTPESIAKKLLRRAVIKVFISSWTFPLYTKISQSCNG